MHPGLTVGEYVAEIPIGRGGNGEVWRGRDVTTGDAVAIKSLRGKGQPLVERLRREAAVLASVAGPHVVGLRDLVVDDDRAFMVMDLAEGGSVAEILEVRERIPAAEVVTILAPIASALAAAHARDLVHGDITPGNILFTTDGRPLLADFGVVQALGATEPVAGTAGYLDPAVANGERPTPASDVFGLAAVGFAALTGESVWGSGTADQMEGRAMLGIRAGLDELAPDVPPALAEAIESGLALDPYDRPDARSFGSSVLHSCAAAPVGIVGVPLIVDTPVTDVIRPRGIDRDFVDQLEAEAMQKRPRGPWRKALVYALVGWMTIFCGFGIRLLLARAHAPSLHVLGAGSAHETPDRSPTVRAVADTSPPDWRAVVSRLDADRAAAFAAADPDRLDAVYLPGSTAYDADLATISSLQSRGLHARGFTATVEDVAAEQRSATTAQLRVVDRLSGYDLVDLTGHVVGHGDPRPPRTFTMWLRRGASGWRVARVSAVS